jgi:hypothetical protein
VPCISIPRQAGQESTVFVNCIDDLGAVANIKRLAIVAENVKCLAYRAAHPPLISAPTEIFGMLTGLEELTIVFGKEEKERHVERECADFEGRKR